MKNPVSIIEEYRNEDINTIFVKLLNEFKLMYQMKDKKLEAHLLLEDQKVKLKDVIVSNSFKIDLVDSLIEFEHEVILEALSYVLGALYSSFQIYDETSELPYHLDEKTCAEYMFSNLSNSTFVSDSRYTMFDIFKDVDKHHYEDALRMKADV